ncbi:MAG: hypothetical protein KDA24_05355 [Deltaproteobacteria bacterium]|nr:hypothetical protein [Deltaproteobacteria bacterium]
MRALITLGFALLLASPAEARRLPVRPPSANPAELLDGPLEIVVRDHRDVLPTEDGDLIGAGRVFSFGSLLVFGVGSSVKPMTLEFASLPDLLVTLVSGVLAENGVLAEGAPAVPPVGTMHVDVQEFWCQNPARDDEECTARIGLELHTPDGGRPWSTTLSYHSRPWESGRREDSYRTMLVTLALDLEEAIGDGGLLSLVQAAIAPPQLRDVSVVRVGFDGGGSALFTDLGASQLGRCVTDGRRDLLLPVTGLPEVLSLPRARSGTSWTTAWFDDGPLTGLEIEVGGASYLFTDGWARRRDGSSTDSFGGGHVATSWMNPCGETQPEASQRALRPQGWVRVTQGRDPLDLATYQGGKAGRRTWRRAQLFLDDVPLSVPDGVELFADAELTARRDRMLTAQLDRARRGRGTAAAGAGLGVAGIVMLGIAGGLTQSTGNGRLPTDADIAAEVLLRTLGAVSVGFSIPVFGRGASEWSKGGEWAAGLRRDRWDLLYSTGEWVRAVRRHNRRVSTTP